MRDVALFVCNIEIDLAVRIAPLEFSYGRLHRDDLAHVIARTSVVSENSWRKQTEKNCRNRNNHCALHLRTSGVELVVMHTLSNVNKSHLAQQFTLAPAMFRA